jgi:hypothetical protein
MSNYTPQVTWSGKDALSSTDPEKIISGADFNTEVLALQTAINSKMDVTSGTLTGPTLISPVINTSVSGSAVLDEDNMASDSATKISTQQALKAYVDSGTVTFTNKTLTAPTINGVVGGTATSQTITTLTTTNVDGILGANTPAAVTGTTITANTNFAGNITGNVTGNIAGNVTGNVSGNVTGNIDGTVGAATPATVAGTTGAFSGLVTASTAPTNASHLVNKTYVDDLFAGMSKRTIVRAATTANVTIATALNNADTLDGVTLATNDLVLVKNQTAAEENGIYIVQASPARDDLFDTYEEHPGSLIIVSEGTTNADTIYICTADKGGTLDTTALAWSKVEPAATAFNGLTDVTITSPTAGQGVTYSGSAWTNSSIVGVGLVLALGG